MRKVLVLQHVAWEPLGTLDPLLKKSGLRTRYVNFGREPDCVPDLEKYNGLIVLGGPMGVYETDKYPHLKTELVLMERALKTEIPVLGICLGAQLMAQVLGSSVRKHTAREMGWCPVELTKDSGGDPFMGHFKKMEYVFQSHGDTFDIPKSAVHLAYSSVCSGQAFRYGDKAYALQFHLEANQAYVDRWLTLPMNQKYVECAGSTCAPDIVKKDTEKYLTRSLDLGETAFTQFLKTFGDFDRGRVFGSGHGKPPKE